MSKVHNTQVSLGFLTGKIHFSMRKVLQQQFDLKRIPLKVEFFPVINKLMAQDDITQQAIADWIGFDRPRTSRMIDELEQAGLVIRKDDPESRRCKLICLSPLIKEKENLIFDSLTESSDLAFQGFTDEEKNDLINKLKRIKINLESG